MSHLQRRHAADNVVRVDEADEPAAKQAAQGTYLNSHMPRMHEPLGACSPRSFEGGQAGSPLAHS